MKILKLFINENIKTWKKLSTKLLVIVTLLSLVGVLALTKFMQHLNVETSVSVVDTSEEDLKAQIETLQNQLKSEYLDDDTKQELQIQLEKYEICLNYNVKLYGSTWKNSILNTVEELRNNSKNDEADNLIKILKEDNYSEYFNYQKQILENRLKNKEIEQQEYDDGILILDLKQKYKIGTDEEEYWKKSIINVIKSNQKSLRNGFSSQNTGKILSAEERQKLEDEIKMNLYRLEHNIEPTGSGFGDNYRTIFELTSPMFIIAVISIVAIIIAGGTISSEISSGTIKFWALTPNKRWKILTAKILSILFYIIVITLVMSLLSVTFANIFFDDNGDIYLYVKNGEVKEIGNTLYTIELFLAKSIPVIMFALFAMMLSTITRNTAASVSFSIALYMGNSFVMTIVNQLITKDWIRVIPLNNLNIADKIFSNSTSLGEMIAGTGENFATSTSLGFSLSVLAVCVILMLVTMFDSFNKRDITG